MAQKQIRIRNTDYRTLQEQLDGKSTVRKEPVGCVWYRPWIVTRHLDECAGARMLPVVAVAVVGIVAIAGGGGRLEMVACSTQQQLFEKDCL
jgi:hypothetical protein